MTKEIDLTQGKKAIVDDEDYEWLNQWKWQYSTKGYAVRSSSRSTGKKIIWMHREITHTPKGYDTDHIDSNTLRNQKNNLRVCLHSENLRNRGHVINSSSGFKGVSWDRTNRKWRAQIMIDGKGVSLGRFISVEEAAHAYDKAALKFFGAFANLNFKE